MIFLRFLWPSQGLFWVVVTFLKAAEEEYVLPAFSQGEKLHGVRVRRGLLWHQPYMHEQYVARLKTVSRLYTDGSVCPKTGQACSLVGAPNSHPYFTSPRTALHEQ